MYVIKKETLRFKSKGTNDQIIIIHQATESYNPRILKPEDRSYSMSVKT